MLKKLNPSIVKIIKDVKNKNDIVTKISEWCGLNDAKGIMHIKASVLAIIFN